MRTPGLEPGWVAPPAPKAGASTNFATSAYHANNVTASADAFTGRGATPGDRVGKHLVGPQADVHPGDVGRNVSA